MLWHALPPELNTARLMAGAGPGPMLQAAAGWEALANSLQAQAAELAATLVSLQGVWTGASSERAIAATTPMVTWLEDAASMAQQRALQSSAQAASYVQALATTPTLIEIVVNHITHAVLTATNFFGINLVPIGFNEVDYFGRMWNQAAAAMDVYQAETLTNTVFEPLPPVKPILQPEVGEAVSAALDTASEMAYEGAPGALRQLAAMAEELPPVTALPLDEQAIELLSQLNQVGQLSGPMQQLMQPIQQFTSLAGQSGGMGGGMGGVPGGGIGGPGGGIGDPGKLGGKELGQLGLLGASPLSNHPLAGGSGPAAGLGLMHAESLPGAGGSDPRTPLMSQLLDKASGAVAPAAAGAAAGSSAAGGAAPMGAMGAGAPSGAAARPGLVGSPALLAEHQGDDDHHEGFDDEDDW
jgi:PPE-repeat protein